MKLHMHMTKEEFLALPISTTPGPYYGDKSRCYVREDLAEPAPHWEVVVNMNYSCGSNPYCQRFHVTIDDLEQEAVAIMRDYMSRREDLLGPPR